MDQSITSLSFTALAPELFALTLVTLGILGILGWRQRHLVRIAGRNVPRRRLQTVLIVFGLMLSTMFIASSLAVDDTITLAVKSVAVYNLGRIDEDVTGGSGPLATYASTTGARVTQRLAGDPHVAGIAPALVVTNVLAADAASRQVRGSVTGLGMVTQAAGPLGDLRSTDGTAAPISALAPDAVYINPALAALLGGHVGDTVVFTSTAWLGQRAQLRVRAIVHGGPVGDTPTVVFPLDLLQQLTSSQGKINHIYVANVGDGLTGIVYTDSIVHELRQSVRFALRVSDPKRDGVQFALNAQQIFGRILTLYTLFALAIGMLLIFLIFVLLAAERRAELAMARAMGMRRSGIVLLLLFEGAAYDAIAAVLGVVAGGGLSIAIVAIVTPTLQRLGYPLHVDLQPQSLLVSLCIGFLFTLGTIWLAAWSASRLTVVAALRDLPEPAAAEPSLLQLAQVGSAPYRARLFPSLAMALRLGSVGWGLVIRGFIPLLLGWLVLSAGAARYDALLFSLGLTVLALGVALIMRWGVLALAGLRYLHAAEGITILARWRSAADRLTALVLGAMLVLYWSLPFDALASLGLPRFQGAGIQIFFIAGAMQVAGAVWALTPNLDILLAPLRRLLEAIGPAVHVVRIALIYPVHHRARTGIGLALFSLVCFTMVVMATIAASTTQRYDNLPAQTASYAVVGQPLFAAVGSLAAVNSRLAQTDPHGLAGIDTTSQATPLLLGFIQPAAAPARWQLYPAATIDGAFLQGTGLPLVARAAGYTSNAAVWDAVRNKPGTVVVDAAALSPQDAAALGIQQPAPPAQQQFIGPPIVAALPGFASDSSVLAGASNGQPNQALFDRIGAFFSGDDSHALLQLDQIAAGPGIIQPTTVWTTDIRRASVTKLTIAGIVENASGQRYGLLGSAATFAPVEQGLTPYGNDYYYFRVQAGVDAHQTARILGSAFFDNGFETTVLQDVLLDTGGPRVFISRVLVGLVGLTLLVGTAALAVTGARAVVERRQQIGMLRALGYHRRQVQAIFLIESLLTGLVGTLVGLVLGLVLCRNIFAVNFFESIQSGLTLVIPWSELVVICAAAVVASAAAALLPAWQAGRVTPADALRYV